ncbi:MAG: hypothetical protein R8P61_18745 [Bacteroidia bacterium]|nr:hypothetical protein [Bacteroidia bacterium]
MKVFAKISTFVSLVLLGQGLFAQGVDFFSTDPDEFLKEFTKTLNQENTEISLKASTELNNLWTGGQMSDLEKPEFIEVINKLVDKRMRTSPDLANFTLLYGHFKRQDTRIKIPLANFLEVTGESVKTIKKDQLSKFFRGLLEFIPEGYLLKKGIFHWQVSQEDPLLTIINVADENGNYTFPVVRFSETDLVYQSFRPKDSTHIYATKGDYNLLGKTFIGEKGRVDWSKLGLDKEDVYCEFGKYKINANFGLVKVDTVQFYYKSMIDGYLVGKFEDRNVGFKSLKKANYPYFKSHGGGVVIDKLIPNLRYEGGFSLQGVRRLGTSYDLLEEVPIKKSNTGNPEIDSWYNGISSSELSEDEKKDDEWGEDQWDYEEAQTSSFESDDTNWDTDEWGTEEEELQATTEMVLNHIKAKMDILRQGDPVIMLQGETFVLDEVRMVGKNLETIIKTSDQDSIYHPGMDALYSAKDTLVTLKKSNVGTYRSVPFASSYHEYFLYFETIVWDLNTDELQFTAFIDRENKVSAIESFDYFTRSRFNQFKNILKFNPIGAIHRYKSKNPDMPIFPQAILSDPAYRSAKADLTAFKRSLPGLEGSGFIKYNKKTQEITPLPKLTNWALAARKKKDFDAIQIISKVDSGAHASMNLEDMDIRMRGVNIFSLSDSVFLRVLPLEGEVAVQKDRNLQFGGLVASGNINFYSSDVDRPSFTFDYESYKIACDSIDSLRFVLVRNPPPGYEPTPFEKALDNTVFEGITGAIHVDDPNNKSGEKDYKQFPVFDSYSRSYLYWEKPHIEGGVYEKDKMNFSLDPFVLPGIENLQAEDLIFEGEFFSSEIFPKFRQTLQVMPDFTLGFKAETPPRGYRIYEDKGKFTNEITLDGNGLQGNGTIEFLGTVAQSDSFVFHFDSVMAVVNNFDMRRGFRGGVYFPKVGAPKALYTWYTKENALGITSQEEAISVFDGQAEFTGTLKITEQGMIGNGEIVLGEIKVRGDSIIFNDMDFNVEGDFIVLDVDDPEYTHFIAEDVFVKYDVYRHKSGFEAKKVGKQLAKFPGHEYATSLAKGEYQRSTRDLKLVGLSSYLKDNYFVATAAEKDSLRFKAEDAQYDIEDGRIDINGVPYIFVADAMITPEDKKVILEEGGDMKILTNALVEADQESKYHKIYEANVRIMSRNKYTGGGKYDYIEVNGKKQYIDFSNIDVNSDTTTTASGDITETDGFYLTERIFFKGKASLDASQKFLTFEGEVKIESENPVFKGAWFTFEKTLVNPDSVFIPIADDLTNDLDEVLTVGLNFVPENRIFYSNFLQAKEAEDDIEVLTASGGLTFDRRKKEFRIGQEQKLKNQTYKGSTVSFNDAQNTITSQGFLNFPFDFADKTISVKMAGLWKEDMKKRQLSTDIIMGVDFNDLIPKEQLEHLATNFQFLTTSSKNIDFRQRAFIQNISELLDEGKAGERETTKFIANTQNSLVYTDIKLAQQLPFTLLMSGIDFNYSREYKALFSDAEVGLVGINGEVVNKKVGAKIVYKFGRIDGVGDKEPDRLTIYLEVDEFSWVYFHFEDQVLYTVGSDYEKYNRPLQEMIDKSKSNDGFRLEVAPEDEVSRFRQDFVVKYIK